MDPFTLLRRWSHAYGTDLRNSTDLHDLYISTIESLAEHDRRTTIVPPPVSARLFDPDSSHDTVRSIAADQTLRAMIVDTAAILDTFDDGDLRDGIEARYGIAPDRNIVARARGLLEPDIIVRVGPRPRPDRRTATIHFQHWSRT